MQRKKITDMLLETDYGYTGQKDAKGDNEWIIRDDWNTEILKEYCDGIQTQLFFA